MSQFTDLLLTGWRQNLDQAQALFAAISAERMTEQPRVANHPANTLKVASPDLLAQPAGLPRWAEAFGSTADALGYLMIFHEALHLGQVMAWRQAIGLPPLD